MISLHTNISSLITQNNMTTSTNKLNQAIERMSTGYKINHAADNAANYSISRNMSTQLSACDVAADNIAMGMDLLSVAQDTIAGMQSRGSRIHALVTQARNGTYGADSLNAMTQEANALVSEINRLYANTEYNGIKLFDGVELPDWAQEIKATAGTIDGKSLEQCAAEHNGFIQEVIEETPDVTVTDPTQLAREISKNTKIGIGNAETLAKLAELVNSGTTCEGKTIILTDDIDLSAYEAIKEGKGGKGDIGNAHSEYSESWTPIGTASNPFQGTFNGNGHKVTGLYINRPDKDYQGLFGGVKGEIKNIGVEGANVTGNNQTGGLAGRANIITNSYATGNVTGAGNYTGGLVGNANNTITNSYATGNVTGIGNYTGGLAGNANNTITNSYATGNVTGCHQTGGLVGYAGGTITNSYATGNVTGNSKTCGLAGAVDGTITNSYATGNVTGNSKTCGLAGLASQAITNSYATGNVTDNNITNRNQSYYNNKGKNFEFDIKATNLQVGINGGEDSQISINTGLSFELNISDLTSDGVYDSITNFLNKLSEKSTELGAAQNRLESALESNLVKMDNLTSSLSTIRDADISKVSSDYIRQQILQQACATLMSTANQSPSIALQLL